MNQVHETSKVITLEDSGRTVVYNSGGSIQADIEVPVVPVGSFSKTDRVAQVRMRSGKIETFGGDLLKQALANGGRLVKILQEGK
jgi:hypothetical protein